MAPQSLFDLLTVFSLLLIPVHFPAQLRLFGAAHSKPYFGGTPLNCTASWLEDLCPSKRRLAGGWCKSPLANSSGTKGVLLSVARRISSGKRLWSSATKSAPQLSTRPESMLLRGLWMHGQPLAFQPRYPVCTHPALHRSSSASCPTTSGFCVFLYFSIPPEMFVKAGIQTIYDGYIATVYNMCVCFHFSLLCVPHPI